MPTILVLAQSTDGVPDDVSLQALTLARSLAREDPVHAVLMGDDSRIREGDIVKRTKRIAEVPVGDAIVGRDVAAVVHQGSKTSVKLG